MSTPLLQADLILLPDALRLQGWDGRSCDIPEPNRKLVALLRDQQALAGAPSDEPSTELLTLLRERGFIAAPPAQHRLALLGSGPLAQAVCHTLLSDTTAQLCLYATPLSRHAEASAAALHRQLSRAHRQRVRLAADWSRLAYDADLVVVASDTIEADRALTDQLSRQRLAHVIIRAHGGHARVGPWVTPGKQPCLRCADLHLGDLDADWPAVLLRLSTQRALPTRGAAEWAAATMAAQLCDPGLPRGVRSGPSGSAWTLCHHPGCSCLWLRG